MKRLGFWRAGLLSLAISANVAIAGFPTTSKMPGSSKKNPYEQQLAMARMLERKGEEEKSRQIYEMVIKKSPKDVEAHHRLGIIAAKAGKFDLARQHFHHALSVSPHDPKIHSDLGYALFLENNLGEAEQVLRRAIEIDSHNNAALNNLGMVLGHQKRFEEAYEVFRQAGSDAEATANLGYLHAQQGNLDAAEAMYSRSLSHNSSLRPAAEGLIQIAEQKRRLAAKQGNPAERRPEGLASAPEPTPARRDSVQAEPEPAEETVAYQEPVVEEPVSRPEPIVAAPQPEIQRPAQAPVQLPVSPPREAQVAKRNEPAVSPPQQWAPFRTREAQRTAQVAQPANEQPRAGVSVALREPAKTYQNTNVAQPLPQPIATAASRPTATPIAQSPAQPEPAIAQPAIVMVAQPERSVAAGATEIQDLRSWRNGIQQPSSQDSLVQQRVPSGTQQATRTSWDAPSADSNPLRGGATVTRSPQRQIGNAAASSPADGVAAAPARAEQSSEPTPQNASAIMRINHATENASNSAGRMPSNSSDSMRWSAAPTERSSANTDRLRRLGNEFRMARPQTFGPESSGDQPGAP